MIPIPKLALEEDERYVITVIPEIALSYINWLHAYYSLHVECNEPKTGIIIRIKNKKVKDKRRSLHISKEARLLMEEHL